MNKFESMTTFVRVVDAGSFAAAARELTVSRSAISKQVNRLEASLGVKLLYRDKRSVRPTPAGHAYYERSLLILASLDEAERALRDNDDRPRGQLRVKAPVTFGTRHLAPVVAGFVSRHAGLRVQLDLTDRPTDPVAEGLDLVVRIGDGQQWAGSIAEPIVELRRVICASPEYLRTSGRPRHPEDLTGHRCLTYGSLRARAQWPLAGPDGEFLVNVQGALCSSNDEVLAAAAIAGLGLAKLPTFIAGPALASGQLEPVLPEYRSPPLVLTAVYPESRGLSAGVRGFVDFLKEQLGQAPWDPVAPVLKRVVAVK